MSTTKYGEFEFRGGHPALDFINTVSARDRDVPTERIGSYADLATWAQQAGIIDAARAAELIEMAAERPRAATAALRRARQVREAGFRLFGSLIEGAAPDGADIELLNRHTSRFPRCCEVQWSDGAFSIDEPEPAKPLDEPLDLVTRGMVDVLTGDSAGHVSRCRDVECSWLFLDRSPAGRRQWCSMADCGNRAKARRHYAKRTGTSD